MLCFVQGVNRIWRGILFLVDCNCGGPTRSFVRNKTPETNFGPQNTFHVVGLTHNWLLIFATLIFFSSGELSNLSKDLHLWKLIATTLRQGNCPWTPKLSTIKQHSLRFVAQFQVGLLRQFSALSCLDASHSKQLSEAKISTAPRNTMSTGAGIATR